MTLEIAVFNISSALKAASAGADRIELCENMPEGGTTPSYGCIQLARKKISIPIFAMIRPRGGDFIYSEEEFQVMKTDINICKLMGIDGIVFGILGVDGAIDVPRTLQLVDLAYPMDVTIHRAFDRTADPFRALEDIIHCGCQRILTSGQVPQADDGKELIKKIVQQAAGRITIMPGSGVRSQNIRQIASFTEVSEIHSSAKKMVSPHLASSHARMRESLMNVSVDELEIRQMKILLDEIQACQP